ncbi:unnamed protein product [Thlaspi arvense]|uniref:BED-type domain-containing protein n=1 Tax=Thlaspi arvense TaxID=13288 RepID=A0AAU9S2U6_THLAR|nr:unnamed protein product [Thlaspi arvense]
MDSDWEPVALTPQKQDSAWKHCKVYKYGDRVQMKCLYCEKLFRGGGITRVKEHLAGKKGQGTICDQVPDEVRLFLQQCIDGTVRRQRKRRKSSPEPLPIAYFPPCEVDTEVVVPSDANNGEFKSPSSADLAAGQQSTGRTKQRTYRSRKNSNAFERSDLADVEVGGVNDISDLIGSDMDNLIPVAISSVKNIVHPSSKERERTVHMATGRFLFDIRADLDAVSSVNFQPFIDAIVSGGFGVSPPANEDLRGWILKSCVEETKKEIDEFDCIEKLVPEDNTQDMIVKDINSYKNAVGIFGRNLAIRARDTMLPTEWWSTYGESCLNLSRFAIRILSQTYSSMIGSGRNFTPCEQVFESKNSIERQRLSDLVFVQYNMRLKRMGVEGGDENVDPLSHSNMELLEDWISRNQVCIEGNGSSDWKSLEPIKRTEEVAVVDETEDLGSGFDDAEIFKGEKEVSEEGYYTNMSEKLFT